MLLYEFVGKKISQYLLCLLKGFLFLDGFDYYKANLYYLYVSTDILQVFLIIP